MELGRVASRVGPHHNQVRNAQCTCASSVGGRAIFHRAMSARAARHGSRTPYHRRFEAAAVDINTVAVRPSLGRRAGDEHVTSWPAPQPSPHRAVHARVLRGRSFDYQRGDELAGRPPRELNAVSPTVRSRSRLPDAVAVRSSRGYGAGEGRLASWPEPQPSPQRAVHVCELRGQSCDFPQGDARAGHAPRGSNAASPIGRSRSRQHDAVAVRPCLGRRAGDERVASWPAPQPSPHRAVHARVLRGRGARRELARTTTNSATRSARARAPWAVVQLLSRGDEHAGYAPRESNVVSPTVRSRSRRPDAVAVRSCLGRRAGEERVASWPAH